MSIAHTPADHLRALATEYGEERPLGAYMVLTGAYAAVSAAGVAGAAFRGQAPTPTLGDGALLAVGTFKLSRMVTKAKLTGFLRAPFTRFEEEGDGPEVNESPRGTGLQRALGELLSCPFCFNQWTATLLGIAWLHAPRATRLGASLLAVATASDVLHVGWTRLESLA
ncbi:MAG: DUF1360 domain-containing protein [Candidatus Dormibacteria bacterium]